MEFINLEDIRNKLSENPSAEFIVNCITETDAVEFLNFLAIEFNVTWSNTNDLNLNQNPWTIYKEQMCYRIEDKRMWYGSLNFYSFRDDFKYLDKYQYKNGIQENSKENISNLNIKQSKKRRIFIIEE